MLTEGHLKKLNIDLKWLDPLNETMTRFEINTPQRIACFLGQALHESANFTHLEENLHYTAPRLNAIFPHRISLQSATTAVAKGVEAIAELMYGHRVDLGNNLDGDGYKYRGMGIFQLTGKANFTAFANAVKDEAITKDPSLVKTPKYACLSAGWYWNTRKLNDLADKGEYQLITKRINGGDIGSAERTIKTKQVLDILKA